MRALRARIRRNAAKGLATGLGASLIYDVSAALGRGCLHAGARRADTGRHIARLDGTGLPTYDGVLTA